MDVYGARTTSVSSQQAEKTRDRRNRLPFGRWPAGCSAFGMTFTTLVNRARADFLEMPGLQLTLPQAVRLWNMGVDDCRDVLDTLVDAGFLRWTEAGTVVWTGCACAALPEPQPAHASVRMLRNTDRSVAVG